MRYGLIVLWMLVCSTTTALAQVSIGIGLPGVSIGINLPLFPELVRVPGYPVYYAPRLHSNFFFYDGMYWVYQRDNWYASTWYNGPWSLVGPEFVPLFVLRIPVRYYRDPPAYFRGWRADAPPRWGEHWGREWEQHRSGWDKWNRSSAPPPAPLPVYQRKYSGNRYPRAEQQQTLRRQNYRYQPRDALVRPHYQEPAEQGAPAPSRPGPRGAPQKGEPRRQDIQRTSPPPRRGGEGAQKSAPAQAPPGQRGPAIQDRRQQAPQGAAKREQPTPSSSQGKTPKGKAAEQEKDRARGDEQGQGRNR